MELHGEISPPISNLNFRQAKISEVWSDALEMLQDHHEETGTMPHSDFKPDYDRYIAMENRGITRLFVVEDGPLLIGYNLFFVMTHHHYRETIWAYQDILYVKPDYRGYISKLFMKWADDQLMAEGVSRVTRGCHEKNDYSGLLEHFGYEKVETQFIRSF